MSNEEPHSVRTVEFKGKKIEIETFEKPRVPTDPGGEKDKYVAVNGQAVNQDFLWRMAKPLSMGSAEMLTDEGVEGAKAGATLGALAVGVVAVATSTFTLPFLLAAGAAAAVGGAIGWIDTDRLLEKTKVGSKVSELLWRHRAQGFSTPPEQRRAQKRQPQ